MATSGVIAANKALFRTLPFDPVRDLAPVAQVAFIPNILVVPAALPVDDIAGLIDLAKREPGRLDFGSAGNGTSQHLAGALFARRAGVELVHVPYRGGAPAVTDLVAGKIQFIMSPLVEALAQIRAVHAAPARRQPPRGARRCCRRCRPSPRPCPASRLRCGTG
jgi:tripartite-type tricarboxylate transporter receptor subunit TctC